MGGKQRKRSTPMEAIQRQAVEEQRRWPRAHLYIGNASKRRFGKAAKSGEPRRIQCHRSLARRRAAGGKDGSPRDRRAGA
ncbi:hypothetical protein [Lysobacter gummosus]|uniref:hypothetical protein n=1 Tax=Lysobacter gummosus TaxID=262324 RepID=UPI00363216B9